MPNVEAAITAPLVIIMMAVMDYVAWQVIPPIAGGNSFWYLAALGLVNIATIVGLMRSAAND